MYDTIVVGGGLLGMASAYHLSALGQSVLVIDRHDPGRATDAGAGILSAATSMSLTGDAFAFAVAAGDYYPQLIAALQADDAGETGYGATSVIVVAMADDDQERFAETRRFILQRKASGIAHADALSDMSPEQARAMFPALGEVMGAIADDHGARIDGRLLLAALRRAGERHGVQLRQAGVERIDVQQRRVMAVYIDGERLPTGAVLVAAGAWSAPLVEPLGVRLPVHPQRGQILHVEMDRSALGEAAPAIVGMRGHYILPWPDGHVVLGATRETGSGFAPDLTAQGCAEVLAEGLRVAPGLGAAHIREWRVGLRPLSDDHLPILGPVPGVAGAYLATGHGAGGLLLGPYSGRLLAETIVNGAPGKELAPFTVTRFPDWQRTQG